MPLWFCLIFFSFSSSAVFISATRFRSITRKRFRLLTWKLEQSIRVSQGRTLLFGAVIRLPVQRVEPHLRIWFPCDYRRSIACSPLHFCKIESHSMRMNPIVLRDCTINCVWSRRRVVVDRFRVSVSRKPCIVEPNGGYFRTRRTRQTCLRGIFGQKDPGGKIFFRWLSTSCFIVSRKPCITERNRGYFRTRGTRQTCLRGIFGREDPWWKNFVLLADSAFPV